MSVTSICIPFDASTSAATAAATSHRSRLGCCGHRNFNKISISSGGRRVPLPGKHRSARIRAVSENLGSLPDPLASSSPSNRYHPSEEIDEPVQPASEDARLTDAETARTLLEVHSKATLLFSGLTDDEIHENIIWHDLPYLTDEHGDLYFEVSNHDDILQTLIGDDKIVQVIIGMDKVEMLEEVDVSGPSDFDFEMEEITGEDSDMDDDNDSDDSDEDVFTIVEDEGDDLISSEASNDWTNLETMQHCHPMNFARQITEVVSNVNLDWMGQPSASIVVQGVLRPAFIEENNFIKKHLSVGGTGDDEVHHLGNIKEQLNKDQSLEGGTAFYKLEMIRIQLVSAYGTQSSVEVKDFRNARPDFVVHHAAKIISQLEAGGDETFQAFKSLCWRLKSIQVEEAAITGVDSLGFDMRICSGTQVQTLRFAFKTRATSESNAEKQLHDLLFSSFQHKNWI